MDARTIIDAADIIDVISDTVTLKKRGANWQGLCPFHSEKSPSFVVSQSKQVFKCFGCGKSGDVVTFVREAENIGFVDALRVLAKRYNIEMPETEYKPDTRVAALQIVLEHTQEIFSGSLIGSKAAAYLASRGLTLETCQKWGLGFGSRVDLSAYDLDAAKAANVRAFYGRVTFPIFSASGRILGFGGRSLGSEMPKYVNSQDSLLYSKSKILYGLNFAKKAINKQGFAILTEGYLDVITLHQSGIENVVSASGTSLTIEHLQLLKKYTSEIVLLFDGDAAGRKATNRAAEIAIEQGFTVRVAKLPNNTDPDSYLRQYGFKALEAIVNSAGDYITALCKIVANIENPSRKADGVTYLVKLLALISDSLKQTAYVQDVAKRLRFYEADLWAKIRPLRPKVKKEAEVKMERQINVSDKDVRQFKIRHVNSLIWQNLERLKTLDAEHMPQALKMHQYLQSVMNELLTL